MEQAGAQPFEGPLVAQAGTGLWLTMPPELCVETDQTGTANEPDYSRLFSTTLRVQKKEVLFYLIRVLHVDYSESSPGPTTLGVVAPRGLGTRSESSFTLSLSYSLPLPHQGNSQ